jgi:hypothetical protein
LSCFAEHATVLSRDADGVMAFLRDPRVVDDPRRHRTVSVQRRQHSLAGDPQDGGVVPAGVRGEEAREATPRVGT